MTDTTSAAPSLLPRQSTRSMAHTKHGHTSRQLVGGALQAAKEVVCRN